MTKKGNLIHKFLPIVSYETRAIEEYLENMALQGLFFQKKKGGFWYFKKGAPKKIRYYVDIFEGASWFDTRAEAETLEYNEFCERNGWNYIFTEGKYQFFCSEDLNAVPIETDQGKKLKMIHKAYFWQKGIISLMWIGLCILNLLSFLMRFSYDSNAFIEISYTEVALIVMWCFMGMVGMIWLIRYLIFYFKNRIRIHKGLELQLNTFRKVKRNYKIHLIIFGTVFLIYIAFACMEDLFWGLIQTMIIVLIILIINLIVFLSGNKKELHSREHNKVKTVSIFVGVFVLSIAVINAIIFWALDSSLFGTTNTVTYTDENGDEVIWSFDADDIPYTLEDAGFELPEDGYPDSSVYEEKSIFCTSISYSDTYWIDLESEESISIYYDKYEFINEYFCSQWVNNYLKDNDWEYTESSEVANEWSADEAYIIESYDDEVLIVFDQECYLISDNLVDSVELKNILN